MRWRVTSSISSPKTPTSGRSPLLMRKHMRVRLACSSLRHPPKRPRMCATSSQRLQRSFHSIRPDLETCGQHPVPVSTSGRKLPALKAVVLAIVRGFLVQFFYRLIPGFAFHLFLRSLFRHGRYMFPGLTGRQMSGARGPLCLPSNMLPSNDHL